MIFKGEKTIFLRSIFWIVFFINFSLSSLFEANGQDKIIWEKYKIEKSKEDPLDSKLKKQDSNFESNGQDKIIWKKYKIEKSKEDPIDTKLKKQDSNFEANGKDEIIWEKYKIEKSKKDSIQLDSVNKPPTWRNRILRFSFEDIAMPDVGERMGLYGIGAYERFNPLLYGGITAYGAATGRRGGFFTGGYTLGMESKLSDDWILDIGGYMGAGGGGAAPDGGGLHIRPHIALKYDFRWGLLGLNYIYVDFPNGDISSDAIAFSMDFPFSSLINNSEDRVMTTGDYFGSDFSNLSRHRSHLAARVRAYSPTSSSKTVTGRSLNNSLGLVGVDYSYFFDENWFTTFETAGAAYGGIGGYAELLAGLGYRLPLSKNDRLALLPSLTIGGAGGGDVETGGGFVARANLALEYRLSTDLSLIMDSGYLTAPDGNFDTQYVGFNLAYVMESFAQDLKGAPLEETDLIQTTRWRFRPTYQYYFDAQRKGGSSRDMQLLGGKIDWMLSDFWYLTGQGLSAYGGGAGGYSEGHWGVGVISPSWKNWQLYGEILIGAGGGGGVDSGSALLYKPSVGIEYNINKDFSLQAGIGKVISREANLDANTLDVGLVWSFGTPK